MRDRKGKECTLEFFVPPLVTPPPCMRAGRGGIGGGIKGGIGGGLEVGRMRGGIKGRGKDWIGGRIRGRIGSRIEGRIRARIGGGRIRRGIRGWD